MPWPWQVPIIGQPPLRGGALLTQSSQRLPTLIAALLGAVAFVCATAVMSGFLPVGLAHMWPTVGLALGGLLILPPGRPRVTLISAIMVAEVAASVFAKHAIEPRQIAFAAFTGGTALLGAALIRAISPGGFRLDRLASVAVLSLSAVVAPLIGAGIGAGLALIGLPLLPVHFWPSWGATQVMSILLVAPLPLTLAQPFTPARHWDRLRVGEALLLASVMASALMVLFTQPQSSLLSTTWLAPIMLWAAVRFGPAGAAVTALAMALVALPAAVAGLGPIVEPGDVLQIRLGGTQLVLAISAVTAQAAAAVVGERRAAEHKSRKSESRFRRIFESDLLGVLFIDRLGVVVEANGYARRFLGCTEADIAAGRVTRLSVTPPERIAEAELAWSQLQQQGVIPVRVVSYLRLDGEPVTALLTAARLEDEGVLSVALLVDITERQRQQRLMAETELVAAVGGWELNCITGQVWWTDETHRIHGTDPARFQPRIETALGFFEPPSRAIVTAALERARTDGVAFDHELRLRTAGGRVIDVRSTGRAELNGGAVTRVYGAFQDITERKQLEAQFLQSQKMEGLGRLAGGVAHDFNNLLTAIYGYLDLLELDLSAADPGRQYTTGVRAAADRAAALVRQLLAFSRRQMILSAPVDLGRLARDVERLLARVLGEDIALTVVVPDDLWPVLADGTQLEQVMINLAVNARDAMEGGGRLLLELRNVEPNDPVLGRFPRPVAARGVLLRVTDTGSGIPAEVLPSIFDPFFTTKPEGRGTGLGLATCYGIIQQTGGQIMVDSAPGEGASFLIWLPRAGRGPEPALPPPPSDRAAARRQAVILLVEDDSAVRQLSERALRGAGYRVIAAASGAEALAVSFPDAESPTLLVTDVVMPGMSGTVLAEQLSLRHPVLNVLFLSGYSSEILDRHPLGPRGSFLAKPFTGSELRQKVRDVLDG